VDIFLQQLINGLVLGSIYALIALGYTMVYGILELINFAHGEVTMIGAMVCLAVIGALLGQGVDLPGVALVLIGLAAAIPACMALGFTIERVAYRPLRRAPRLAALITAIGVSIVLQNVAMLVWGKRYISFPPVIELARYDIAGAHITNLQIAIVAVPAVGLSRAARIRVSVVFPAPLAPRTPKTSPLLTWNETMSRTGGAGTPKRMPSPSARITGVGKSSLFLSDSLRYGPLGIPAVREPRWAWTPYDGRKG